jgi:hypothetical protein
MRQFYLIPLACAALVAGTTMASAQRFRDNPPGWAFQRRGIIEMNGGDPWRHEGYGSWRGAYASAWPFHHYRHHLRHHWR